MKEKEKSEQNKIPKVNKNIQKITLKHRIKKKFNITSKQPNIIHMLPNYGLLKKIILTENTPLFSRQMDKGREVNFLFNILFLFFVC